MKNEIKQNFTNTNINDEECILENLLELLVLAGGIKVHIEQMQTNTEDIERILKENQF